MTHPLNLLLVEESADDAALVLAQLRTAGFDVRSRVVATEAEYLAALDPELDVILCDYRLPQFDGKRALDLLKARGATLSRKKTADWRITPLSPKGTSFERAANPPYGAARPHPSLPPQAEEGAELQRAPKEVPLGGAQNILKFKCPMHKLSFKNNVLY